MSPMLAQDDARERQMLNLFNLTLPPDRTRGGLDAVLDLDDGSEPVPFELKSSTGNSVSTVRDFGPAHIVKWRRLHWLFAFYANDAITLLHCYYASPADMADWITEKEAYIRPDLVLADRAPQRLTHADVVDVVGDRDSYTAKDAKAIMKNQWAARQYEANADLPKGGYSPDRMLGLLRERCGYVIRRGATLNNPHIPGSYLSDRLEPITRNHAATLRSNVTAYLAKRAERVAAGEKLDEDTADPIIAQASASATDEATA